MRDIVDDERPRMPYAYDDFRLIVDAFEHGRNPAVYLRNLERFKGTVG